MVCRQCGQEVCIDLCAFCAAENLHKEWVAEQYRLHKENAELRREANDLRTKATRRERRWRTIGRCVVLVVYMEVVCVLFHAVLWPNEVLAHALWPCMTVTAGAIWFVTHWKELRG